MSELAGKLANIVHGGIVDDTAEAMASYIEQNYVKKDGLGEMIARKTLQYQDLVREQEAEVKRLKDKEVKGLWENHIRKLKSEPEDAVCSNCPPNIGCNKTKLPEKIGLYKKPYEDWECILAYKIDGILDYLKERMEK